MSIRLASRGGTLTLLAALWGVAAQRDDFAARAVREIAALRPGVTAAAWLAARPRDHFASFAPALVREDHHGWCGRASVADTLAGGLPVVRYAYFYPPEPPASFALPAAGPTLVQEQCVLGTVWLEAAISDTVAGNALAAGVRAALTRAYGAVTPGRDAPLGAVAKDAQRRAVGRLRSSEAILLGLHFFGAGAWQTPGRWQVDSTLIASAFDRRFGSTTKPRVLAFAFLPFARLGSLEFGDLPAREGEAARQRTALATRAARLADLGARQTERLLASLAAAQDVYLGRGPSPTSVTDSDQVATLDAWVTGARALPARRRAAALLAADQVLAGAPGSYILARDDSLTRRSLERLGATFVYSELDGGYNYAHGWLDEALRLDPGGPVGRLATVALLRLGFNETGMCGGGPEPFRRVSAEGERLLASGTDSASAEVHFLVAAGYADIVALASGAAGEYTDSARYTRDATEARRRAIEHYRAGLALDHSSIDAVAAWREAWRLLAGLPPRGTHFVCVYD